MRPTIARAPRIARRGRRASRGDRWTHAGDGRARRSRGWQWADGIGAARHGRRVRLSAGPARVRLKPDTTTAEGAFVRRKPAHLERIRPMGIEERPADPQRDSPTRAPSRAVSVASVSADGRARSSSEYWSTRPGAGSTSIVTMSIAAWGGCDSRSSTRSVRSTLASRIAAGNCSMRACARAIDEPQIQVDRRRAPVGALERRGQRLEQPRQHERQRLQRRRSATRARCARGSAARRDRARADPHRRPRHALQRDAGLSQPRRQRPGRQRRQLAERRQPPAREDLEPIADLLGPDADSQTGRGSLCVGCHGTRISRSSATHDDASGPVTRRARRNASSRTGASAAATSSVSTASPGNAADSNIARDLRRRHRHALDRDLFDGRSCDPRRSASREQVRDPHPRESSRPVCELGANRRRIAEQTPQPADIEHDAVAAVALQPRRKLFRDGDRHIGSPGRSQARIQRRHDRSQLLAPTTRGWCPIPAAGARDPIVPSSARATGAGHRAAVARFAASAAVSCHRDRRAAGTARQMFGRHQQRHRLAAFDHARQAKPGRERQRANRRGGTSARSSTTSPNPPACSTRFIALSARVASPVSRIHNSRDRSSPVGRGRFRIEAIAGIDERHQLATRRRPPPSARQTAAVRPDERPPTISDRCPRRRPPPSAASIAGTPVAARSSARCRAAARASAAALRSSA